MKSRKLIKIRINYEILRCKWILENYLHVFAALPAQFQFGCWVVEPPAIRSAVIKRFANDFKLKTWDRDFII